MKIKKIHLFIVLLLIIPVVFLIATLRFNKYDNITVDKELPELNIRKLLSNNELKIDYKKRFLFNGKFYGCNAVINNSTFVNIIYYGEIKDQVQIINKKEFKENQLWGDHSFDQEDKVARSFDAKNYPFTMGKEIFYKVNSK